MPCFLTFTQEVSDVWQKVNCAFIQRGRCDSRGTDTLSGGSRKVWLSCVPSSTFYCVKMHSAREQVSPDPLSSPDSSPLPQTTSIFLCYFFSAVWIKGCCVNGHHFRWAPHGPRMACENCWGFWKNRLVTFHKLTTLEPNLSYSSSLKPVHCTI